jgi:hypothetical protein
MSRSHTFKISLFGLAQEVTVTAAPADHSKVTVSVATNFMARSLTVELQDAAAVAWILTEACTSAAGQVAK